MKTLIFSLLLLVGLTACNTPQNAAESSFWVRGNCGMCQETIENALNNQPGVYAASYDLETHRATVQFDNTALAPNDLHEAVAAAGYATRQADAAENAYQNLPLCCKKPEDQ